WELEKDRPDSFGAPAFQGGFADAPTAGQFALVEVFDTNDSLLTGCCGNVRSVSEPGCAGVRHRHVRADVRAQLLRGKTRPRKQKLVMRPPGPCGPTRGRASRLLWTWRPLDPSCGPA